MKQLFPLAVLVLGGVLGSIFLGDYINLDSLRDNQDSLSSYRQEHPVLMAASFLLIYFAIVSFSLPGAAVASLVGGFLFGLSSDAPYTQQLRITFGANLVLRRSKTETER